MPEWISYRDNVNSCEWNFTLSGNTTDCNIKWQEEGTTPFYMELWGPIYRFSFQDVLSFKMTFTVDPDDNLPRGKGDMPSMIVAYPSCVPSNWGSEVMCGPYKGNDIMFLPHDIIH